MDVFFTLFGKLAALYAVAGIGFASGRLFGVRNQSVSILLVYGIVPVVIFDGVLRADFRPEIALLPVLVFAICCSMSLLFNAVSRGVVEDASRSLLAFSAGTGNTGYFGIPVALALLGDEQLPLIVLSVLGFVMYENSLGFFLVARGRFSTRQSFLRVAQLPSFYALIAGVVLNLFGWSPGETYAGIAQSFLGANTVLGMMIIGLGLAEIETTRWDARFMTIILGAKFIAWPTLVGTLIFLDRAVTGLYSSELHEIIALLSLVPVAANTVTFATALQVEPNKATLAVVASSLIALFFIPAVISLVM